MRVLPLLWGSLNSAQLFSEDCFKFGIDNLTQNFGGLRGRRATNETDYGPMTKKEFRETQRIQARTLGRIVNGTAAEYTMWPFVAMIGQFENINKRKYKIFYVIKILKKTLKKIGL